MYILFNIFYNKNSMKVDLNKLRIILSLFYQTVYHAFSKNLIFYYIKVYNKIII